MNYKDAKQIAMKVAEELRPYCNRIGIAGSIRRKKSGVKDIEIVTILSVNVSIKTIIFLFSHLVLSIIVI